MTQSKSLQLHRGGHEAIIVTLLQWYRGGHYRSLQLYRVGHYSAVVQKKAITVITVVQRRLRRLLYYSDTEEVITLVTQKR